MTRPTLDDIIGAACLATMIFGLPWLAAIAQEVLR